MRQIRETLRYHFNHGISNEKIGKSLNISKGSVHNTLKRFNESKFSWPLPDEIGDFELENQLYPQTVDTSITTCSPSFKDVEKELAQPHVTLQILYEEYIEHNPNGIKRSAFYKRYSKKKNRAATMKMSHKGGDKLFVDYSGDSISFVERTTGEVVKTELFVCSWGASSYCYAEVTMSQKQEDFVMSHVRAFEHFNCIPNTLVPDNLKSAVIKSSLYDPIINKLYGSMSEHYDLVVLPARVRRPQDKAVVESNVLHIQRFILAKLRKQTFYSLSEINDVVKKLLAEFNARPMKDYGNQSRNERFANLDLPLARKSPSTPFEITAIASNIVVPPNYHVRFEDHYYSVPHQYIQERVDIYLKGEIVEIYYDGKHLCRHKKSREKFQKSTNNEHMPADHQFISGVSAEWYLAQASKISPEVVDVIRAILMSRHYPEQSFGPVAGVLRLAKVYGNERLKRSCMRAIFFDSISYQTILSILKTGIDKEQLEEEKIDSMPQLLGHENIRGGLYYFNRKDKECISKQY